MSSNYEYHQLLEYLYFNDYADSYENAEHLIQQLSDEEYQDLYEGVFSSKSSGAVSADAADQAAETHKTMANAENTSSGDRRKYRNAAAKHKVTARRMRREKQNEDYVYENTGLGGNKRAHGAKVDQSVSDKEADEVRAPGRQQRAEKEAARKKQELKDTLGSRGASLMASKGADSDSVPMASAKKRSEPTGGGVSGNAPVLRRRKPNGHATRGASPEHTAAKKAKELTSGGPYPKKPVTPETKARGKKIRDALKKSKKWGTPEARNEAYVLEHLISEGYADDYNSALAICESMSDEWFYSIISEDLE
jgi:hypothetical protein